MLPKTKGERIIKDEGPRRELSKEEDGVQDGPKPSDPMKENVTLNQIVKINDRGVIVIPKEIMDRMDIGGGGKLLLLSIASGGKTPMIVLLLPDHQPIDDQEMTKDHVPE